MNKRDLKKLKIDPSYVVCPERFLAMFGIECDNIKKLSIHDLHYILGKNLNHVGTNKVNCNSVYKGDIILIGTLNNFKAYYRPIVYKAQINNKITEKIEVDKNDLISIRLSELCKLCMSADTEEDLDKYLDEIYARSNVDFDKELEPVRNKIYAISKTSNWY